MTDPNYILDIHQELRSGQPWSNPGLKSVVLLAWGVTLRQLNQYQNPTGKGYQRGGGGVLKINSQPKEVVKTCR